MVDMNSCMVNHIYLFLILAIVSGVTCCLGCLAFYCSPGPGNLSLVPSDPLDTESRGILRTNTNPLGNPKDETKIPEDKPQLKAEENLAAGAEEKENVVNKSKVEGSESGSKEDSDEDSSSEDSSSVQNSDKKGKLEVDPKKRRMNLV